MGKERNDCEGLDKNCLTQDEIVMLAYALEYNHNDDINNALGRILEKIEHGLHVDTYVGNRLSEYGKIMGWSKE